MNVSIHRSGRPRRRWIVAVIGLLVVGGLAVLVLVGGLAAGARWALEQRGLPDRAVTGGAVVVRSGEHVGDVTATGAITVERGAWVQGDVTSQGGDIDIAGHVSGSVTSLTGNIRLGESADIGGPVVAPFGEVARTAGAQVQGQVFGANGTAPAVLPVPAAPAEDRGLGVLGFLLSVLTAVVLTVLTLALGSLAIAVWPRQIARMEATLEQGLLASAVVGLLTAVLLPFVAVLAALVLVVTIVGPVIVFFIAGGAWFVGLVTVGLWIGERLAHTVPAGRWPRSALGRGLAGLGLILAVTALPGTVMPWLGWPLAYLLGCLGLGAMVLSRFGTVAPVVDHLGPFGLPRNTHPLGGPTGAPPERRAG